VHSAHAHGRIHSMQHVVRAAVGPVAVGTSGATQGELHFVVMVMVLLCVWARGGRGETRCDPAPMCLRRRLYNTHGSARRHGRQVPALKISFELRRTASRTRVLRRHPGLKHGALHG
jgi:hypothetical protein